MLEIWLTGLLADEGVLFILKISRATLRLLNYATIIQNENQRLKQQVERVLQMAQSDKEDIGLKRELTDIHDLINDAVNNSSLSLQARRGKIKLILADQPCLVSVDKLHIVNVFYNLLDNAIKYNRREPEITIHTKTDNRQTIISVSDNGIGISPENQKKVFHRFFRVPTGNIHDVKGFGLGLNYVKLIVERHGGKVWLTSELEKGSAFMIEIPQAG